MARELASAISALESAQIDIDDCESRIDEAGNEIENVRGNVENAMAVIEDIEVPDDNDKIAELEQLLMAERAIIAVRDDRIARLTEALDEVQTIALDAII
jgi:uncharacterized membrane protein